MFKQFAVIPILVWCVIAPHCNAEEDLRAKEVTALIHKFQRLISPEYAQMAGYKKLEKLLAPDCKFYDTVGRIPLDTDREEFAQQQDRLRFMFKAREVLVAEPEYKYSEKNVSVAYKTIRRDKNEYAVFTWNLKIEVHNGAGLISEVRVVTRDSTAEERATAAEALK